MGIQVFGITGTNGKTSASYMLRSILRAKGAECALIGTISHEICDGIYEPINTTPGEETLSEYFTVMEKYGTAACVMEVSSHGLAQNRIKNIEFDYAAFTNLTRDHLDYHNSMEEYYSAKKMLFLKSECANVINIDDSYGKRLFAELEQERAGKAKNYTFSLETATADFFCQYEEQTIDGTDMKIYEHETEQCKIHCNIPGLFSVKNCMAAVGLARAAGIDYSAIKKGIEDLTQIPGRFEKIELTERGGMAIVDYAHSPHALESLLKTVAYLKSPRGRIVCIFGCGGERDRGKRTQMGKIAGEFSDYCIITNDNPRNEDPQEIADEIEEGLYETGTNYHIILDRKQAIKWGISLMRKGDFLIVAGKGHEREPFNDAEFIKEHI